MIDASSCLHQQFLQYLKSIAHYTSELTDIYDPVPRTGSYWWRVRALDADGRPMTVWSAPQHIELAPEAFTVGAFGDSISHDGG